MPLAKPRNPAEHPSPNSPRAQAGERAERQTAFYLGHAFADDPEVSIFHDLRLTFKGADGATETAQLDHLLVHPFGFVLVESKSAQKITANAEGDFSRFYCGQETGMPSPVAQVKRQGETLRRVLNHHAPELLGTMLGVQGMFGGRTWDFFVAVAPEAIIDRRPSACAPELLKADVVPEKVKALLKKYRENSGIGAVLNPFKGDLFLKFSPEELQKICAFLKAHHVPRCAGIPACPLCGKPMAFRSTGKPPFWGCSEYSKSKCHGKRSIQEWPAPAA